ncbi:rhomboid-like protein [Nocardia sp. NPDC004722]
MAATDNRARFRAVWRYVRSAPGTYLWLTLLLITTVVMRMLPPDELRMVLGDRSTNLHHLREDPIRVLIGSAFWLPGGGWPVYVLLYSVFHAPAERWLGTVRWLICLIVAHVGATYLSEGVLYWAIHRGLAPADAVNTLDIGVSYALAGIVGILAYHLTRPWCFWYALAAVAFFGTAMLLHPTFTAVGHFTALLIGFACYPLTRGRPGPWTPHLPHRTRT